MSWLSELKWSNRDEHLDAMLTGDAELDESVVSTYDRPQGFKFKLAQRLAAGLLPAVGENDKGKTLQTNETTGAPEWAEASGGGGETFIVHGEIDENENFVLDKTANEIYTAVSNGSIVIMIFEDGPAAFQVFYLSIVFAGANLGEAFFTSVNSGGNLGVTIFKASSGDGVLTFYKARLCVMESD